MNTETRGAFAGAFLATAIALALLAPVQALPAAGNSFAAVAGGGAMASAAATNADALAELLVSGFARTRIAMSTQLETPDHRGGAKK